MTGTYNLADLFESVVDVVPDRTAVVTPARRLTFAELDERANRLAHHLADVGVGAGDHVALLLVNGTEYLEATMAAFKVRAVPVNVNYRYVERELQYLFEDSDSVALVVHRRFVPRVEAVLDQCPLLRHVVVVDDDSDATVPDRFADYEAALAAASADRPPGGDRSSDDIYIAYTGGTTGMPKGVVWRHEDIFFAALSSAVGEISSPEEITTRSLPEEFARPSLIIAPLMHGAAQWGMCNMLFAGAGVALYTERGLDPDAVWDLVERERCMGLTLVGDAMARPLADALAASDRERDLSGFFRIGSGGGVFSPAVQAALKEQVPHVQVADSYGASEMGAGGTSAEGGARRFHVSPELNVLDERLEPVEPGEIGHLARTGHIPLGYHKDEAKTAATFPVDAHGVRWSVPGDLATVDADGVVTLLGRGSQCINTGGEKVYPEEVEEALKAHPAIYDALVVGVPDERWGERVVAVVEPRGDERPSLEEVTEHCRRTLAGYKVPRALTFVDAVQRSPAGKADYRWSKDRAEGSVASS
jgi:fatty-acyl-CoA synthase